MNFLHNAPNIPKHEIYFDMEGKKACNDFIDFNGRRYHVAMMYVVHRMCGTKIRGLVWKTEYNRINRVPSHRWKTMESPCRIKALYCPECRVRVGKATRKMLQIHGRLHGWHGPDHRQRPDIGREEVGCYYVFPRGIELSPDYTEIIGVDPEYTRCMDDDEYERPLDDNF